MCRMRISLRSRRWVNGWRGRRVALIPVMVLRKHRCCNQRRRQQQRADHFAAPGAITVTVCIMPPCM